MEQLTTRLRRLAVAAAATAFAASIAGGTASMIVDASHSGSHAQPTSTQHISAGRWIS